MITSSSLIKAGHNDYIGHLSIWVGMELSCLGFPRIACYRYANTLVLLFVLDAISLVSRTLKQLQGLLITEWLRQLIEQH